jgi:hypothetical protein
VNRRLLAIRGLHFLLVACLTSVPSLLGAQIVRGRVTERGSGATVGGVVVSIIDATTRAPSASTLSDAQGHYALRAPGAGSYRIEAKRIGVRRFLSDAIALATGETREVDIAVEGLAYALPEVVVSGLATCSGSKADAPRIGALWDEARTALFATRISLRDRLFRGTVSRYVRELDPRSHRVLKEEGRQIQGVVDKPFRAVDADSLSARGYVETDASNIRTFHAPDADVLLSDAFVRDHCFRLAPPSRERRGLTGVAFAPAAGRHKSDISGTMWLDARTFELQLVDFRYVNTDGLPDDNAIGGEVHFAKLANGAWVVRKWFIRLPSGSRTSTPMTVSGATPNVFARAVGYVLREEGGHVTAEAMLDRERPAGLAGTVHDSLGKPLVGAVVVLSGTPYRGTVDALGQYRISGIAAGTFSVVVEHPAYLAFGIFAAEAEVSLPEGLISQLQLEAPRTREIRARLCPSTPDRDPDVADLRLHLLDAKGQLVPFTWVRVDWREVRGITERSIVTAGTYLAAETDQHGAATFCAVPAGTLLPISVLRGQDRRPVRADSVRLNTGELRAIRVRMP